MNFDKYRQACLERFLRYVAVDTQSEPGTSRYPSTEKQLVLLQMLADELKEMGVAEVELDAYGYVTATVPTNVPGAPAVVGLMAHVDTSPEMSGKDVKPIIHTKYQGQDLVLPDDPATVIKLSDNPELQSQMGNDIVTASGTTLLGADNKAGVAEIMTAVQIWLENPELPRATMRIAFTPDEEIGAGTKHFDLEKFGAQCAYTIDSSALGQLDTETFSADAMTVTFKGFNTHPGNAKGKMVNAIKVAADFIARLPKDTLSPETTEGRVGFFHPMTLNGSVDKATVIFIIRDFVTAALAEKEAMLEAFAAAAVAAYPGASYEVEVVEQYRNMREILDQHPQVVDFARQAIARAGIALREEAVRGGTDGAHLCFQGLPTPNIFAGEHNYHSRYEWVSVQDMQKAVEVIVHLGQLWSEFR